MGRQIAVFVAAATLLLVWPTPAAAYVGPGAGLTIIGAALAFVGSVLLGLFGFVWYPLKRVIRAVAKRGAGEDRPAE